MELVSIPNTDTENFLKPISRYFKLISEDYNTTNNIMIWGNSTHGIWNTDKWGVVADAFESEVIEFLMQYINSYTEDFIDTDFDSEGNASWSTTGSVTFTSGQLAQSKSIDFNNGTVTIATLDSTEVSGSFDYEMTANGSSWESVIVGAAHTFSSTGTDLKWRATENAASTGEISQVTVVDYH